VLTSNVQQCLSVRKTEGLATYSLRRNQDDRRALLETAAALYTRGCAIEWPRVVPAGGRCVALPAYPWQRKRFWVEIPSPSVVVGANTTDAMALGRAAMDELVHAVEWRNVALAEQSTKISSFAGGSWLVFADIGGTADALVRDLEARGARCIRVRRAKRFEVITKNVYDIDETNPKHYQEILALEFGRGTSCSGVIHLFGLDATPFEQTTAETLDTDQRLGCISATFLVQALLKHTWRDKPKVWLFTRGARCVLPRERAISVSQGSLVGFARTISLEHPELPFALVDLPVQSLELDSKVIVGELSGRDWEETVALRSEGRFVTRLVRSKFDATTTSTLKLHADATYLITGGLGGLGLKLASWMVARGARHVALAGRREPTEAVRAGILEMEKVGAKVWVLRCDVSIEKDVVEMVAAIKSSGPPLRGVVHAAGTAGERRPLLDTGAADIYSVLSSKTRGAWNLHMATLDCPLDFFVLYSSASAILGLIGHAGYAAANSFLDGLADQRTSMGLAGMSIQWGAFAEVGLAAREGRGQRMGGAGLGTISSEEGYFALERLLEHPRASVGVFRLHVRQWLDVFPQSAASPFWSELQKEGESFHRVNDASAALRKELENAEPAARRALLEKQVRGTLSQVFRMEPSEIDRTIPFVNIGADSLMSLEVKNRLEQSLGLRLTATILFTYANMAALVEYLLVEMAPERAPTRAESLLTPLVVAAKEGPEADDLLADFEATMLLVRGKKT